MKIQFNTDKTIEWNERLDTYFSTQIRDELDRFTDQITRVEVHVSDENGIKEGFNDIRCLMEVRVEGKQPIASSNQADTIKQSISGAISKVKATLKTTLERTHN